MSILVRNGTAFIEGAFVRADVRIRDGRIAALGALSLAVVTAQRAVARLLRKRSFRADERKARHSDV